MQQKIDNLHELLDAINDLKTDIIKGIEASVRLYIDGQDDKNFVSEQSAVKFVFKTGSEQTEHSMDFHTDSTDGLDIPFTKVYYNGQALGVFRYDDGDFDKYDHIKHDIQEFIIQFICNELKNRGLSEIIIDLFQVKNIHDTANVHNTVGEVLRRFGLAYNIVEGTTINTVTIYREDPYDIIAQNNTAITMSSSYFSAFTNISLIELTKVTLMGLFDTNELKVVNE